MSDEPTGTPAEGAAAEPTSTGPDYAPVLDRVGELANTVGELQSGFQQFMQSQQPQPEPEPDPWDVLLNGGEPEQPEPEQMLDLAALQQAVQQQIAQANAPLLQQLQEMQRNAGRERLLQQIPELQKPEVAQQAIESMQKDLAGAPPEVAQWLVNSPEWIAKHFKAAEAEKLAASQAPASGQVPSLEPAGGAVPGGDGGIPNPVHEIFGAVAPGLPPGFR